MKLYLDDERPAPEGWTLVKTAEQAIRALESGAITDLSLDFDLSPEHYGGDYSKNPTGLAVLGWLGNNPQIPLPKFYVHSWNARGSALMLSEIDKLKRMRGEP